uniref:Uncharacterized protein n=1 Tax=Arundo donax TaxID=35708 RepID=A0A0A9DX05_ARUDO
MLDMVMFLQRLMSMPLALFFMNLFQLKKLLSDQPSLLVIPRDWFICLRRLSTNLIQRKAFRR